MMDDYADLRAMVNGEPCTAEVNLAFATRVPALLADLDAAREQAERFANLLAFAAKSTNEAVSQVVKRLEVAEDAIARVEALHVEEFYHHSSDRGFCAACTESEAQASVVYPCPTIRALRGVGDEQ